MSGQVVDLEVEPCVDHERQLNRGPGGSLQRLIAAALCLTYVGVICACISHGHAREGGVVQPVESLRGAVRGVYGIERRLQLMTENENRTNATMEVCHTAKAGEQCYEHIQWAINTGFAKHPEWYPGLSFISTLEDFQAHMHEHEAEHSKCPMPCKATKIEPDSKLVGGCPRRAYSGKRWGADYCFAQLAGNSGVRGSNCVCRQGCDTSKTLLASTNETVSFKNLKRYWNNNVCSGEVLLTSPREYYADWADLLRHCGRKGLVEQFEVIVRDSWDAFQTKICKTAMWQCFHAPGIASVSYLHMQSFAFGGYFHGMPTTDARIGICVKQTSREETREVAIKLATMF